MLTWCCFNGLVLKRDSMIYLTLLYCTPRCSFGFLQLLFDVLLYLFSFLHHLLDILKKQNDKVGLSLVSPDIVRVYLNYGSNDTYAFVDGQDR